jgi:hypothetical protein
VTSTKQEDSVELNQLDTGSRNDVNPPRKLRESVENDPKAKTVEVLERLWIRWNCGR